MKIRWDWHVHSQWSPCGNREADVAGIAAGVAREGVERWGLTDHLFTERNVPDLENAAAALAELNGPQATPVFAVEASALREWDIEQTRADGNIWGYHPGGPEGPLTLYCPDELVQRLGIRYVIAGAHWCLGSEMDKQAYVRRYHEQNMFLATHPQVDIIAHPWWWRTYHPTPDGNVDFLWLEDFSIIPESMHDEFSAAVRENGKLIEASSSVSLGYRYGPTWVPRYWEYLARLREDGCRFTNGSDSHAAGYNTPPAEMEAKLDEFGFTEADFWPGPDIEPLR